MVIMVRNTGGGGRAGARGAGHGEGVLAVRLRVQRGVADRQRLPRQQWEFMGERTAPVGISEFVQPQNMGSVVLQQFMGLQLENLSG